MRPKNPTPSYNRHTQSGRARACWTDSSGKRREKILPGAFGSTESKTAFARLVGEVAVSPTATPADDPYAAGITVAELLLAYLEHAAKYYRDAAGNTTNEYRNVASAIRSARLLYGDTPANTFGPLKLKAIREQLVKDGICRTQINKRTERLRRAFRWATAEEMIPPSVYESLRSLPGLRAGRTEAVEREPIRPVDELTIRETLPLLPAHVRAMVELMSCSGMRPGEVCRMTLNQIERGSAVWIYRPRHHKTSHIGKGRMVPIGPRGREILSAFLGTQILDPDEPIFSPARQHAERLAEMRGKRLTPVQPSQVNRAKKRPKKQPGTRYTPLVIAHAVRVAISKENARRKLVGEEPLECWNPYRLRHTYATRVRKEHGLEAAQVMLGHSRADVTQVYAERDETLAVKVAAAIG